MCTATILSFESVADNGAVARVNDAVGIAGERAGECAEERAGGSVWGNAWGNVGGNVGGWRLVTNRDERHSRAVAKPPTMRTCGDRQAVMPIDPISDGTWVAMNDAGLAITLLNLNPPTPPYSSHAPSDSPNSSDASESGAALQSRGGIIPRLMAHASVDDALADVDSFDTSIYAPFTLVLVNDRHVGHVRWDGQRLTIEPSQLADGPRMFTSSGLGDHHVELPRRALFDQMIRHHDFTPDELVATQDSFHRHRWPDRPHLSVCMRRDDARTVSMTVVERLANRMRMTYYNNAPDVARDPMVYELPIDPAFVKVSHGRNE